MYSIVQSVAPRSPFQSFNCAPTRQLLPALHRPPFTTIVRRAYRTVQLRHVLASPLVWSLSNQRAMDELSVYAAKKLFCVPPFQSSQQGGMEGWTNIDVPWPLTSSFTRTVIPVFHILCVCMVCACVCVLKRLFFSMAALTITSMHLPPLRALVLAHIQRCLTLCCTTVVAYHPF